MENLESLSIFFGWHQFSSPKKRFIQSYMCYIFSYCHGHSKKPTSNKSIIFQLEIDKLRFRLVEYLLPHYHDFRCETKNNRSEFWWLLHNFMFFPSKKTLTNFISKHHHQYRICFFTYMYSLLNFHHQIFCQLLALETPCGESQQGPHIFSTNAKSSTKIIMITWPTISIWQKLTEK